MNIKVAKKMFPPGTPVVVYPYRDENGDKCGKFTIDIVTHEPYSLCGTVSAYLKGKGMWDCDCLTPILKINNVKDTIEQLISKIDNIPEAISIELMLKSMTDKASKLREKLEKEI